MRPRLVSLPPVLLLAVLFLALPPDGQERSPWLLFAGKFHLLTIHFPIALLYLVPLLEIVGRHERFPHLKASVEFVLVLAMAGSMFAASLGWALARSGGYSGRIVTQHMWGGLFTAAACWLCWALRSRMMQGRGTAVYALALVATVALVSWTGYRGGQLTQGENHLTDGMPASLKSLFGISSTGAGNDASQTAGEAHVDRNTFYGARVQPILATNCYSCHGADKQRGEFRLDSYNALMRGGKHGLAIKAGDVQGSLLFHRITLPQTNDDAMPPQGKRPLTSDEIKTIEAWMQAGAAEMSPVAGVQGAPKEMTAAPKDVDLPGYDPATADKAREPYAKDLEALQKKYPGLLQYESRTSAAIALNASLAGEKFGDADLAALKPLFSQIDTADFSGTAITDGSALSIAAMKNLRLLRLTHTRITDNTVLQLKDMPQLLSINLLGTGVTSSSLSIIPSMPRLHHVYVAETKIQPSAVTTPALKEQLVF